jgi:hypothetical protein
MARGKAPDRDGNGKEQEQRQKLDLDAGRTHLGTVFLILVTGLAVQFHEWHI